MTSQKTPLFLDWLNFGQPKEIEYMSVQVLFAQYSKRNNSTSRFTDHRTEAGGQVVVTELSCFLKEGTDSENPVIRIQVNFVPTSFNVCYIYGFNRYYWIRKWEYNRSEWLAYCEIDALATMREEIRTADFYILRADRDCTDIDDYASDYAYPAKNKISIATTNNPADYRYDPFNNILIQGNYYPKYFYDKTETGNGYFLSGWVSFGAVTNFLIYPYGDPAPNKSHSFGSTTFFITRSKVFQNFMLNFYDVNKWPGINTYDQNPLQYIKQATYIVKNIEQPPNTKAVSAFVLGWIQNSIIVVDPENNGNAFLLTQLTRDESSSVISYIPQTIYDDDDRYIELKSHPHSFTRGKYLNYEPYTKIELVFDGLKTIEIPTMAIPYDCDSIHIKFRTDLITGSCLILVYGANHYFFPSEHFESKDEVIFESRVELGFPIQLAQITTDVKTAVTGIVGSAGTILAGTAGVAATLLTGGVAAPFAAAAIGASAGGSGISRLFSSIREGTIPRYSSSGNEYITISNFFTEPYIRFTFIDIADEDFDETGRVVNKTLKINNMLLYRESPQAYHGYIKCLNGDFKSIYSIHEKEIAKQYLENGFFFEE